MQSEALFSLWKTGHAVFEKTLLAIKEEDLAKRIAPESNSIGFLLRHIGEAEHNFSHMFFGTEISIEKKTLGPVKDTGEFTRLAELLDFAWKAEGKVKESILKTKDEDWDQQVETRMGTFKRRDAIGRLLYHTNYHTGQIGLILKYGRRF